jgi:DNA polymerase II small subunit/DNA polymerase delta subunit B
MRPKLIETPEKLMEIFEEYREKVKDNPRHSYSLSNKTGEIVAIPLEVPLTLDGFEVWAFKEYGDIHNYFDNAGDRYSEYKVVCTHIRREIRQDQINGGMVGQYNPSITQRLNNLTEKSDITTNGKDISEIKVNIITSGKD